MKKAAETIATFVAAAAIILGLAALIARSPLATAIPGLRGTTPMIVLSGSMEPKLPVGGIVFVKQATAAQVKLGDVIAFLRKPGAGQTSSDLTTHRVIAIQRGADGLAFRTKGDANDSADILPVPARAVVGIAGASVPYLGYLAAFARSPLGFVLLIVLPALFLVVEELLAIAQELRARKSQSRSRRRARRHPDASAEQSA